MRLSCIAQIGVTVRDLDRAVDFYGNTLGVPLVFRAPKIAFFDGGGVRLMLGLPETNQGVFSSTVYFNVDDIKEAAQALKSRGVAFERDPHLVAKMADHDVWLAFFRDPDGNLLALLSEQRALAPVSPGSLS